MLAAVTSPGSQLTTPNDPAARRASIPASPAEAERARVIEVEDALAEASDRATKIALADERETLIARHMHEWEPVVTRLAHARTHGVYGLTETEFEHGLARHIGARANYLPELDALAQTGCTSLKLEMVEAAQLERLITSPLLPRLRRLDLHFMPGVDPSRVAALVRASTALDALALSSTSISPDLTEAIGEQTQLGSLALDVTPGTGALCGGEAITRLTNLRSLIVASSDLDAKQLAALLASPCVAGLERLALRDVKLGAKGCKLLGSAEFGALRHLDLSRSSVGAHAAAFVASLRLARLDTLILDAAKISAKQLPALLDALALPALRVLGLGNLRCKADGAAAIAASDALTRCGVTTLSLANNAIGDDGAEALATAEGLAGIRRLSLAGNGLRVDGIAALADSPLLRGLEVLEIQNNKIQTKGAIALAGSVAAASLRAIDIEHNWIGSKGATALFGAGKGGGGLRALELARLGYENNFGDAALEALVDSDLRLRGLIAGYQGSAEATRRLLESPAAERLRILQMLAGADDSLAAALSEGRLGPHLHTVYVGDQQLGPERIAALDRRFACSAQRLGSLATVAVPA
jgi:hypothetical protein